MIRISSRNMLLSFAPCLTLSGRAMPCLEATILRRPWNYEYRRAVVAARGNARLPVLASEGVRINKCFKSHYSRRESDALVEGGRVAVNGETAFPGMRVQPGDVVTLDGNVVEWQRLALGNKVEEFVYLKFHKPLDVVTTTNLEIENNLVSCLRDAGYDGQDRIFFVGRLDEQTSGVILGTTDGALVNAALGGSSTSVKEYIVRTDKRVSDEHVQSLRDGVVIKTVAQYSERSPLIAPTLPCRVERVVPVDPEDLQLRIFLREGRNRQIRKMMVSCGTRMCLSAIHCFKLLVSCAPDSVVLHHASRLTFVLLRAQIKLGCRWGLHCESDSQGVVYGDNRGKHRNPRLMGVLECC
jgi:23S rRNA pseudouridine2604 synthase